jgi:hypothetical protein
MACRSFRRALYALITTCIHPFVAVAECERAGTGMAKLDTFLAACRRALERKEILETDFCAVWHCQAKALQAVRAFRPALQSFIRIPSTTLLMEPRSEGARGGATEAMDVLHS